MIEKEWTTKAGYRAVCRISCFRDNIRHHRCGYVEVPKDHPAFGYGYYPDGCDPISEAIRDIDVHGNLTFSGSGKLEDGYPADSDGHWFGFDCAHYDDGDIDPDPLFTSIYSHYEAKSEEYVVEQCEQLAEQLKAIEGVKRSKNENRPELLLSSN